MHRPLLWLFVGVFFLALLGAGLVTGLAAGFLVSPYSPLRWMDESWSDKNIATTKQRGDTLIAAIERYRAQQGSLPETLDALVPDQLAEVLPPTVGDEQWRYGRMMSYPSEYYLLVNSKYLDVVEYSGAVSYGYYSHTKSWNLSHQDHSF
ncbi:MAG: hypothetical protein Q9O74_08875 [Planctomycetota bacterium]|nr:hypothetical protein [Planctomycetota bacterium]